jgi:hypothetical protein
LLRKVPQRVTIDDGVIPLRLLGEGNFWQNQHGEYRRCRANHVGSFGK